MHRSLPLGLLACIGLAPALGACGGGSAPPPPSPSASSAPLAEPPATATASGAPAAAASGAPSVQAGDPAGGESSFVAHVDEAKAAQELGADHAKLLQIAKLSPKTHKSLLKSFLWKAAAECKDAKLVDAQATPGLLLAKPAKVRAEVQENLKAAGALAKQRGLAIELVTGFLTIQDAVKEWNGAILDRSLSLVKAAPATDQKEKSFAGDARKALGSEGPKGWGQSPCETGRTGGWSVEVQLVTLDASGNRGQVLVKAGTDGTRFAKDTFESIYWEKKQGKNFRTLTEIMSAGKFVRQCSDATIFLTSPKMDGSWRCRQDTESWDPPNRPIPAWQ